MRFTLFWWIFLLVLLLLDWYCFQSIKLVTQSLSQKAKSIIYISYWSITIFSLVMINFLQIISDKYPVLGSTLFSIIIGLYLAKIILFIFLLVDDLQRFIRWVSSKIFHTKNGAVAVNADEHYISRSVFLNWMGVALGGTVFASLIYGFSNKYNYQVKKVKLKFDNLPQSFKGLKIVQISDIHSGSFHNKEKVQRGVEMVLNEKPDIIFFTGDLVNYKADEMQAWKQVFNKLKAPMGVYSILGNHDYGEYARWKSEKEKQENLAQLKAIEKEMGWRLLLNEHIYLEKNNEKICVIGVENWSASKRFPKYGDLQKAYEGCSKEEFKILLSHDPSHWKAQVISDYKDINLTLSGHTHGMQFGVEIPGFKWSPVEYVYKEWNGLYTVGAQKLYVNKGFGFIGYPGRVGMLPEITVFELG